MTEERLHMWQPKGSLSVRYVAMVLVFVIVTGLILGAAVTLAGARIAAEERRRSLEYASAVVASSLIGVVADQDSERIEAQLAGLLASGEAYEIECIRILDGTGAEIAETSSGCTCDVAAGSSSGSILALFTEPQVIQVPIEVDGLVVADLSVQFRAVGLETAIYEPMRITALILLLALIVTATWGGWMVMRTVVEPIGELRDAAARIADGERDISLGSVGTDEIGELAHALTDMTKQLERQEAELRDSYATLEDAYDDKADLARRLEQTMELKSDFVAVASHELRSPLAVVQLYSEMINDQEFGDTEPELAEAIEAIASAVARLSTIVSSLMDVALLERGLMPLEYGEVAMDDLVDQAVSDAGALAKAREISVVLEKDLPEVVLRGDSVRLRQVLDNLLSNAVKYSPKGGVVSVLLSREAGKVNVAVTDEGVGVPEDRAQVLFELFGRADTRDDAEVSGLGLGLPISKRIAEAHGGGVTYEARPEGRGAVFTLWLPAHGAPKNVEVLEVDVLSNDG